MDCILDNDGLVVFEEGEPVLFSDDHAYDFVHVLRQHIAVLDGRELSFRHKDALLVPVAELPESQLLADLDVCKVPFVDVVTVVDPQFHVNVDGVVEVKFEPNHQGSFLVSVQAFFFYEVLPKSDFLFPLVPHVDIIVEGLVVENLEVAGVVVLEEGGRFLLGQVFAIHPQEKNERPQFLQHVTLFLHFLQRLLVLHNAEVFVLFLLGLGVVLCFLRGVSIFDRIVAMNVFDVLIPPQNQSCYKYHCADNDRKDLCERKVTRRVSAGRKVNVRLIHYFGVFGRFRVYISQLLGSR